METTVEKTKQNAYIRAVGRRKTSTASVKLTPASKQTMMVNGKPANEYFMTSELYSIVISPFSEIEAEEKYEVTVLVKGGGIHSQAEAVRHGISRVLVEINENTKTTLKKAGFLKRDPRAKERRKFGLKKARKAPQWSKR